MDDKNVQSTDVNANEPGLQAESPAHPADGRVVAAGGRFSTSVQVEAGPEPRTRESPTEALNKQLQGLSDRISEVEKIKEKLAEFNFQTITVILGVLTLVAAVPLLLIHGGNIASGQVAEGIFILLFIDSALAVIWMAFWAHLNFRRRG